MPDIRQGEVVIEIDHPANSDVYFFPIGKNVESKIINGRSGPGCPRSFATILSIPGQRIQVDPKAGTGRIVDALADKENSAILEKVKVAAAKNHKSPWNVSGPRPTIERKLNPVEVHNWLFWMARLVENGHATQVAGEKLKAAREYRKGGDIKAPSTHPRWTNAEFKGGVLPPLEVAATN